VYSVLDTYVGMWFGGVDKDTMYSQGEHLCRYSTGPNNTPSSIGRSAQCYAMFDTCKVLATIHTKETLRFKRGKATSSVICKSLRRGSIGSSKASNV
jgi:hypothetical protein